MKPSANLFLAAMFIGLGVGMLFGEPGAGIIIGMGVGFLLQALVPQPGTGGAKPGAGVAGPPSVAKAVFTMFMGVAFILWGLDMAGILSLPGNVFRLLGSLALILVGLAFLVVGLEWLRGSGRPGEEE